MDMDCMDIWITYGHMEINLASGYNTYRLPDLGLAIYQQPPRLVTSQGTQAQLVGAGIAIPACWAVGIVMPTSW
jgi:hypothetical protein